MSTMITMTTNWSARSEATWAGAEYFGYSRKTSEMGKSQMATRIFCNVKHRIKSIDSSILNLKLQLVYLMF